MIKPYLAAALAAVCFIPQGARPEALGFEDFFQAVAGCALDIGKYGLSARLHGQADALIVALPTSGAVRGLLVTGFFFSPGRGAEEKYGLVFNAPLDVVAEALPELAVRRGVNGYLRRLARLSDETGEAGARRKTLLMCVAGIEA